MNLEALAISVAGGLVAVAVIALLCRWRVRFAAKRLADRIIRETPSDESKEPPTLTPESLYIVEITRSGVSCSRPDKTAESVTWDDLQCVEILNTDEGPFRPDVFWILHGSNGGCVIPQGAAGERQFLQKLQELPGFDNDAVIKAMSVMTNGRTVCWRRRRPTAG